jgi:apolipoprotein N-acyltransferase
MRQIPVRLWVLAATSAILQIVCFPIAGPVPAWRAALGWVALAPLVWVLLAKDKRDHPLTVTQAAALSYLCGFLWYFGDCNWIYQTMYLYGGLSKPIAAGILVLFCLYLGMYHLVFGMLVAAARRRFGRGVALVAVPFAWVAVELARARITGLPWDLLGVSQVDNPRLTGMAPYTGVYGMSFVIAAVNALWLVRARFEKRRYGRVAAAVVLAGLFVYFLSGLRPLHRAMTSKITARATLVQQNLDVGAEAGPQQSADQLLAGFSRLSLQPSDKEYLGMPEAAKTPLVTFPASTDSQTDLIVWPESPAPFEERDPRFREAMSTLAQQAKAPVIAGNVGIDRNEQSSRGYNLYNSASFITPDGNFAGRYDKMHLVPFGEYVPFANLFFFAKNLLSEVGTFDAGRERVVFHSGDHRYGVFICYESVFADEVREFTKAGAQVLINISNDGWYGDTGAPWQHLNMVRMRAIENHRWVLRATNTGVTASIAPDGRVMEAAPRHVRTSLRVGFGYEDGLTFYAAHGDLFAYGCALVTAVLLALSLRRG